ncbi:phosphoribosyl pyrophosphate synthetase [Pelomyxa schiedti]|nr:phosphoribosyl pyrophosphate synthetase [Pelomyxa schiedti]
MDEGVFCVGDAVVLVVRSPDTTEAFAVVDSLQPDSLAHVVTTSAPLRMKAGIVAGCRVGCCLTVAVDAAELGENPATAADEASHGARRAVVCEMVPSGSDSNGECTMKNNMCVFLVRALRPSAHVLATARFPKILLETLCIRPDTLGRLLYSANVHSGSTTMVCESCQGLLLLSVAERISGSGKGRVLHALLPEESTATVLPFWQLFPPTKLAKTQQMTWSELCPVIPELSLPPPSPACNCDCLVVATTHAPLEIAKALLRHLKPAGYFAFYSPFIQELTELHEFLLPVSCELQLSETWKRDFQLMPQATHPNTHMNDASGYILSGIKIKPRSKFSKVPVNKPPQPKKPRKGGFSNAKKKGNRKP